MFTVCGDCVFLIFGKNTEPLYFCKNTVCTDYYISKTEFQLFGNRNRVTFEFICTHWENFIPILRILQLHSLSRLAKDFVFAPIFFLVPPAAIQHHSAPLADVHGGFYSWTIPTLHFTTKFLPSFLYPFSASLNILIEHFCALWLKLKYKFGVVVQLPQKP